MKSIASLLFVVMIAVGILWLRGGQYNSNLYNSCRDQNFSNETCVCYSETVTNVMGGNNIIVATNLIFNEKMLKKAVETANEKCNNKIMIDSFINIFK